MDYQTTIVDNYAGGAPLIEVAQVTSGTGQKRTFNFRFKASAGLADVGAAWVYPGPPTPEAGLKDANQVDLTMKVDSLEVRGPRAVLCHCARHLSDRRRGFLHPRGTGRRGGRDGGCARGCGVLS